MRLYLQKSSITNEKNSSNISTSTTASGVNTTELNSKWTKFTQLAEKKQYKQAIEEGVRVSILFTENRQYKEAFATCRQMDALFYAIDQERMPCRKTFSLPRLIIIKHSVCRTKAWHAIKSCFRNVRKEKTKKA